jgi:hypothetical protein
MKYIDKLYIKIVAAIVIGLLLSGAGTKIKYSCAPVDGAAGCVSFDKAIMHPNDLFSNKQHSLVHFSEAFVITSFVSFAVISIINAAQKKSKTTAQLKG